MQKNWRSKNHFKFTFNFSSNYFIDSFTLNFVFKVWWRWFRKKNSFEGAKLSFMLFRGWLREKYTDDYYLISTNKIFLIAFKPFWTLSNIASALKFILYRFLSNFTAKLTISLTFNSWYLETSSNFKLIKTFNDRIQSIFRFSKTKTRISANWTWG